MKKIRIIKETKDLREGREKTLPVGHEFRCTYELAKQYLDKGLAEPVGFKYEIKKSNNDKK